MRWLITVPFAALLWSEVPAQSPDQARLDDKARRMREQLDDGSIVRTHVRVDLRLRNGNRLQGVAKDSQIIEQKDGALRFAPAMMKDADSTLQLWYSQRNNSFVILPFVDVLEYRINERLTTAQLQVIEQELAARQRELDAQRAQQEAAKQAENPPADDKPAGDAPQPGATPAPGAGQAKTPAKPEEKKTLDDGDLLMLLQEFPPADGWSAERKADILRRKVTVGVAPTAQEKRFLEVFDDWQKAVAKFVGTPKSGDNPGNAGNSTGSNRSGTGRRR